MEQKSLRLLLHLFCLMPSKINVMKRKHLIRKFHGLYILQCYKYKDKGCFSTLGTVFYTAKVWGWSSEAGWWGGPRNTMSSANDRLAALNYELQTSFSLRLRISLPPQSTLKIGPLSCSPVNHNNYQRMDGFSDLVFPTLQCSSSQQREMVILPNW